MDGQVRKRRGLMGVGRRAPRGEAEIKRKRARKPQEANSIEWFKGELEKLRLGEHLCGIYRDKKEQYSVIVPFLLAGLKNNEKCVYILDESNKEEIVQALKKSNISIGEYIDLKQLEFLTKEDTYIKDGYFDPDRMVEILKQGEEAAIKDGYKGLRILGEMDWALRKPPGAERLMEYEAKLNHFLPESRSVAICQYNERKFTPKILLDVIYTHPKIVFHGSICDNPYYTPPDDFLARMKGEITQTAYERVRDDLVDKTKRERERKRAEEALRASEERYRSLVESSSDSIYMVDKDLRYLSANKELLSRLGLSKDEVVGKSFGELHDQKETKELASSVKKVLETGNAVQHDHWDDRLNRALLRTLSPVKDNKTGEIKAITVVSKDITEFRMAEKELRKSEKRYRTLIETMNDGIAIIDKNNLIISPNDRFCEILGYSQDEIIGHPPTDFMDKSNQEIVKEQIARRKKGERGSYELTWTGKDGHNIFTIVSGTPIVDADGHYNGAFAVVTDITELKKVEEALKESEEKYSTIVEKGNDGIVIIQDGLIKFVNKKASEITGIAFEETIGKAFVEFVSPAFRELIIDRYKKRLSGIEVPTRYEIEILPKNGKPMPIEISASLVEYEGKPADLAIIRDITERKRAEDALRESEQRFKAVFDNAVDGIYLVERGSKKIITGNKAFCQMLGYNTDEVKNLEVKDIIPEEDLTQALDEARRQMDGEIPIVRDTRIKRKDGSVFYANNNFFNLTLAGKVYVASILRDITESKRAEEELKRTLAELERSNKDLQQFAYVASHDLQEPLRAVASFTQLLAQRYKDELDSNAKEFITFIVDEANRMQRMINDLLMFSRLGTRAKSLELTDLHSVLGQAISNLSLAIKENNAIVTNGDLPALRVEASQFVTLFQNLVDNGIKFRSEKLPYVHISADRKEDEWVFSVRDNGIGIDPQYFDRIFVIFQRLHDKDKFPGTGIGLAICKKIVERHGGRIWVESKPGEGSTFYFTVPISAGSHKEINGGEQF